ncbi:hypothetical protein Tco_1413553 [Tanacetum coccineum]
MPYPRFTKAIIQYFISKDKSISMRNRMFMHSTRNDSVLGTLKFILKGKDNQVYGKTIPREMINQEIKNSTTYQTYLAYSTGAAKPKKARKWKQPASALKKNTSFTIDDNIISNDPDAALEFAKSINKTESTGKRRKTSVTIRNTLAVTKKKTPIQTQKLEGIEMLSEATFLEEAQMKKAIKLSKRETSFHHQKGGSSEGAGSKLEVPDESKAKRKDTNEGDGSKPEVPDVSKAMSSDQESENESWRKSEDDNDVRQSDDERIESDDDKSIDINKEMYDDVNLELKDAELFDEGKGDEEMTDAEKVNAEEAKQEVASAKVQDEVQATTTTALATQKEKIYAPRSISSRSVSLNYVPESKTLSAIHLRISDLEKEVQELNQVDHSITLLAIIKSEVPMAVKEYLGTTLGDALHKAL